jgi:3-phenylpropionate/trans-cinnamate dioxygenase ferredoxin reductase component
VSHVVIVGAGLAGVNTVTGLRAAGFLGTVTLIGDETGRPYDRPPLSKQYLIDPAFARANLITDQQFTAANFDYVDGVRVLSIDPPNKAVRLDSGRTLTYDKLVLATGASPRPLTIPGGEHALLLRTETDARRIRHAIEARGSAAANQPSNTPSNTPRVVVVGGGFIGLEVAASARASGCQVTVLEAGSQLLTRGVPQVISRFLQDAHQKHGVTIEVDVALEAIHPQEDGTFTLHLRGKEPLVADVVVAGIGAAPNVGLAADADLIVANGIVVDRDFRTSDADIFAIGDCASFQHPLYGRLRLEVWRSAVDHGLALSRVICGLPPEPATVPWFWSDQYDLGLQVSGIPDRATTSVVRDRVDGAVVWFGLDESGRLTSAAAVGSGTQIARDIRVSERLIAAGATPDPADLRDATVELRLLAKRMLTQTGVAQ